MTVNHPSLLIGGDLCPMGENEDVFKSANLEQCFGDLLPYLLSADLSIVNLECPLIREPTPIAKYGPTLGADISCINAIRDANIGLVSLANNHIFDHGVTGLESTISACVEVGVATVGAANNMVNARRVYSYTAGSVNIGVLAVTDHEFSIAKANSPGAASIDIIELTRQIVELRKSHDFLTILVHGGHEHLRFPSPKLRKLCRYLVEIGIDLVVVQHTHCVGCVEHYEKGVIVYGQGNFVFDYPNASATWKEGFLIQIEFEESSCWSMSLIPFTQDTADSCVRKLDVPDTHEFLKDLSERSEILYDKDKLDKEWQNYKDKKKNYLMSKLLGHNPVTTKLNKSGMVVQHGYSRKSLLALYNVFNCEAHREILEDSLDEFLDSTS